VSGLWPPHCLWSGAPGGTTEALQNISGSPAEMFRDALVAMHPAH